MTMLFPNIKLEPKKIIAALLTIFFDLHFFVELNMRAKYINYCGMVINCTRAFK